VSHDSADRTRAGRRATVALLAVLVLAAAVRLVRLGDESVWLDEATSIRIASRGVAYAIRTRSQSLHPPLYESLLSLWVAAAGTSEAAVRLPSAAFGILACYFIYLLGRDLADRHTGLIAALLGALTYFPIYYAREARMYAMLMALTAASMWLMWRALQHGTARRWVALALVNIALAYTHLFGGLVVVIQNLYFAVVWLRRRRGLKAWVAVQAGTVLALLPWVVASMIPQAVAVTRRGTYLKQPTLDDVWDTLRRFYPLNPRQGGAEVLAIVYTALALLGVWWLVRRREPRAAGQGDARPTGRPAAVLLGMWLVLPLAITVLVSRILGPCFVRRCLIVAAPPASILLAMGFRALGRRVGALGVAVACVLSMVGLVPYYRSPRKAQWRPTVRRILKQRRPGDCVVICARFVRKPFNYYCRVPPEELPRIPVGRDLDADELREKLPKLLAGYPRAWLVMSHAHGSPLSDVLRSVPWATRTSTHYRGVDVGMRLYELRLPAPAAKE